MDPPRFAVCRRSAMTQLRMSTIQRPQMPSRLKDFRQGSLSSEKRSGRLSKMVMNELIQIIRSPGEIKTVDRLSSGISNRLSIVDVDMSVDLKIAKVFVSTVGSETEKKEALKWLGENCKPIRYALAQRMKHLRTVPELRFASADMDAAMGIMNLLEQLRIERESAPSDLSPEAAAEE